MAYGDLSTLAQIAPITAGGFAGANQAQDEQMNDLKQKQLADMIMQAQQEAQQKAQMNPLLLAHQGLVNQGLQAGLPGIAAKSDQEATTAAKARGTLSTDIDAGNVANRTKMFTEVGQHFGSVAGAIEDNPGVSPHTVFAQQLQNLNVPPEMAQGIMQRYANVPPGQLAARLKADGDRILRETPAYTQATDVAGIEGKNRLAVANAQGANALAVENARIAAGKYNKKSTSMDVNQALLKYGHTAAATAEIYDRAAQIATEGGDDQEAARYTQLAQNARLRAAEDASNRGLAKPGIDAPAVANLPQTTPPAANAPVGTGTTPAQPNAHPVQSLSSLSKLYPGVPPDQLRAAYKRKFGVDLK